MARNYRHYTENKLHILRALHVVLYSEKKT
jgi:hypothetical protein